MPSGSTALRHFSTRQAGIDIGDDARQFGDGVDQVMRSRAFKQVANAPALLFQFRFGQGFVLLVGQPERVARAG
ncbi:hypothetical protein D3C86_2219440 [compost metagenome]